jgi:hypothetical protein
MVLNPQKNFLGIYAGTKYPFLGQTNFSNYFWLHLVPSKKKTQVVPGTEYGVFR